MRVAVYFNIRKRLFSIRLLEGPSKGTVLRSDRYVALTNVEFRVQPAGQRRARSTGQKNVHAFVVGSLQDPDGDLWRLRKHRYASAVVGPRRSTAHYNPFKHDTFVDAKGAPLKYAEVAELSVVNGVPSVQFIYRED